MTWLLAAVCGLASIPAGLRWLRVAQREHYLAPSVTRFAWRWWTSGPVNMALAAVGLAGVIGTAFDVRFGFIVAAAQVGPVGLTVTGVTSPLSWTDRLRRLSYVGGALVVLIYVVGGLTGSPLLVVTGLYLAPALIDLALLLLAPVERSIGEKWVGKAAAKLKSVGPEVVAITGSYGKTTTKMYLAHLLEGSRRTVASPASFNNRMGLARAINEGLTPGTEVFVAEMGTYGPGEIADLSKWVVPTVAALVAIGPVHLERFGSEQAIVRAKAEILDRAGTGVICVDHPLLAELAGQQRSSMRILEVSTTGGRIAVDGVDIAAVPDAAFPANAAVAMGIGMALEVPMGHLIDRLADLPVAEHRQSLTTSAGGFLIIDDTFNSNPAGAARALEILSTTEASRRVVVTPGMVELGPMQGAANEEFAAEASRVADDLLIVGRTNRESLLRGATKIGAAVTVVKSRADAVAWVRSHLGPGDAVLYENDLPDHYP